MDLTLRPMSTSQILDRTFQLYRTNFVLFAGIAALPPALKLVLDLLKLGSGSTRSGLAVATGASALPVGLAYLAGILLASAASVFAVSMVHLGKTTTIKESFATIRPYFWRLVGMALLMILIFMVVAIVIAIPFLLSFAGGLAGLGFGILGFIAVVAGVVLVIHLYARISLATAACVMEDLPAATSIRRSWDLTSGASGRIWLVILLTLVVDIAFAAAIAFPGAWLAALFNVNMMGKLWDAFGEFFATTLAGPISTISLVLIYYDLRVRKEAFDLQLMMEAVGVAQPGQAQAQAAGGSAPSIG
jgi:hypothetical protein